MAITAEVKLKNALLVALGVQLSGGTLELQTAGSVEVATLTLSASGGNALNTPSSGSATFKAITADPSATGGVVTKFVMKDSGGDALYSGTVTGSGGGGDLEVANTTIGAGKEVTALTITVGIS